MPLAKMRFTELYLSVMGEGGSAGKMLLPGQKEKFLALDNGSGSGLGEGLGSRAGIQGCAQQSRNGWLHTQPGDGYRFSPLSLCMDRLEIPSWAILG